MNPGETQENRWEPNAAELSVIVKAQEIIDLTVEQLEEEEACDVRTEEKEQDFMADRGGHPFPISTLNTIASVDGVTLAKGTLRAIPMWSNGELKEDSIRFKIEGKEFRFDASKETNEARLVEGMASLLSRASRKQKKAASIAAAYERHASRTAEVINAVHFAPVKDVKLQAEPSKNGKKVALQLDAVLTHERYQHLVAALNSVL